MTESRIVATDRLRREGRWEEASAYRDQVRKQAKAEGKTRTEASDIAWTAMIEKFPPLPVTEEDDEAADLCDLDAKSVSDEQALPVDWVADVMWVYRNLANRDTTPDSAPTSGAWGLLKWARDHRGSRATFSFIRVPEVMVQQGYLGRQ